MTSNLLIVTSAEEEVLEFEVVLGTTTPSFTYDVAWTKDRNNATSNILSNTIAGDFYLRTDLTAAEVATIPAVNSDDITFGFNLPTDDASNTDGSTTSITKKNSFMSAVGYVGTGSLATVGHSLTIAPELILVKNRDGVYIWAVYSATLGNTNRIRLNDTNAADSGTEWNSTSPTSSVFTVNAGKDDVNGSGDDFMAFCFASVAGKCKVGSVTIASGTMSGDTDLGFPLGWGMFKITNTTGDWEMINSETTNFLEANTTNTEATNGADRVTVVGNVISNNGLPDGDYIFVAIK